MRLVVRRRPRARRDLLEIWNYVADSNEAAADRILFRIERVLATLADNPEAGRARDDVSPGLRSFPSGKYVLFYRVASDHLMLVRAISGHRDIEAIDFE